MADKLRVFLSSTFSDFALERRLIHRRVLPRLQDHCAKRSIDFTLSDLRWGVTKRDIENDRTVGICLDEVEHCRIVSPKLNFLLLLGEREGSILIPPAVPSREWLLLLADADRAESSDPRAKGLTSQLESMYPTHSTSELRRFKRSARYSAASVTNMHSFIQKIQMVKCADAEVERLRIRLTSSITHLEIYKSRSLESRNRNNGAIAILRTRPQSTSQAQSQMWSRVRCAYGDRAMTLRSGRDYRSSFVARCTDALLELIESSRRVAPMKTSPSRASASSSPLSREHQRVAAWAGKGTNTSPPLAVIGPRESGKTTFLREAVQYLHQQGEVFTLPADNDAGDFTYYKFTKLLLEWSLGLASTAPAQKRFVLWEDLRKQTIEALSRKCAATPVFIVVDDFDRLFPGSLGLHGKMSWLAGSKCHARLLLSCAPDFQSRLTADASTLLIGQLSSCDCRAYFERLMSSSGSPVPVSLIPEFSPDLPAGRFSTAYVKTIAEASLQMGLLEPAHWAARSESHFRLRLMEWLIVNSPFSRQVTVEFLSTFVVAPVVAKSNETSPDPRKLAAEKADVLIDQMGRRLAAEEADVLSDQMGREVFNDKFRDSMVKFYLANEKRGELMLQNVMHKRDDASGAGVTVAFARSSRERFVSEVVPRIRKDIDGQFPAPLPRRVDHYSTIWSRLVEHFRPLLWVSRGRETAEIKEPSGSCERFRLQVWSLLHEIDATRTPPAPAPDDDDLQVSEPVNKFDMWYTLILCVVVFWMMCNVAPGC